MKKRKILVALLASLCVSAGAAGLAACSDNKDYHDPALYAAYQAYVRAAGDNAMTYEDWFADIMNKLLKGGLDGAQGPQGEPGDDGVDGIDGEDGVGIEDVNIIDIDGKDYFEFIFTSGKIVRIPVDGEGEKIVTPSFTIKAIDNNGDPVANAYFRVGYDAGNYMTEYLPNATAIRTNNKGIGIGYAWLKEGVDEYRVSTSDPLDINLVEAVPKGYSVSFEEFGYSTMTRGNDGNYTVTVNFKIDNSWAALFDESENLVYRRYMTDLGDESNGYEYRGDPTNPDDITVEYEPMVKRVNKNKYNYFTFSPYSDVMGSSDVSDTVMNKNFAKARTAALGVYRIRWTANNSAANVTLNYFNFFRGNYAQRNDDGSPADTLVTMHSGNMPTDSNLLNERYEQYKYYNGSTALNYSAWLLEYEKTFSGSNYVDVEVTTDQASAVYSLGFISDMKCNVTITVERIGDVATWTEQSSKYPMPENEPKAENKTGSVKDVPLNSTIVKGSDNYYHVGTADGPVVYVQLTKPTRVNNENSMVWLSDYEIPPSTPFESARKATKFIFSRDEFDEESNSGVHIHTDYSAVVQGYGQLANNDGLYPVNDLLKTILENFCTEYYDESTGTNWTNYEYYWIAACQYYGPVPNGSQEAPYDLSTGSNTVTLGSGTTYVSFRTTSAGYYSFSAKGATINATDATEINGVYYVKISAYSEYVFSVSGSGSATVNVSTINASRTIQYSMEESVEKGTAEHPFTAYGTGVYLVNISHNAYDSRLAFDLTAMETGTYSIKIVGSNTAEVLDNNYASLDGKTITLYEDAATRFWLDDSTGSASFFLVITRVS